MTVNRSSTPPLGALVLTEPLLLKKNGNRASRVGPVAVMKDGVVLPGATPLLANWNCGIGGGACPADGGLRVAGTAAIRVKPWAQAVVAAGCRKRTPLPGSECDRR